MKDNLEPYKRFIFIGIINIALGVTFSTTLKESFGSLGIVFIAIGGLLFIIGMNKKQKEAKRNSK